MDNYIIGERVKKLREARGISQKDFAKKLNITASRLSNWENGYNKIPFDFIPEIASLLGGSVDALLGLEFTESLSSDLFYYYVTLNDEGREALLKYAADLCEISKYTSKG
ncbi:MAG: helix-turn-helix transcriptional regulator [Clostridia bacterium]|nr:helix-turn-helix transcriptional regulator [Clostridia bacterium]